MSPIRLSLLAVVGLLLFGAVSVQTYRLSIDGEQIDLTNKVVTIAEGNGVTDIIITTKVDAEPLPSLLPGPFMVQVRPGNGTDPTVWNENRVPTKEDDLQTKFPINLEGLVCRRLEIARDVATLGDMDVYGSVIVRSKLIGSEGTLKFHVANDRDFIGGAVLGPILDLLGFHLNDTGLWGMPGSEIDLDSGYKTSWASTTPLGHFVEGKYGVYTAAAYGTGVATLDRDLIGWEEGDILELCDEKGNHTRATLTSVEGRTIRYSGADDFQANIVTIGDKIACPKVANLTRKIKIVSADVKEGDDNHRAHTIILSNEISGPCLAKFIGVEFLNLGPRGFLGRYPVHWHMCNDAEGLLDSCSIWSEFSPSNRLIVDHHTRGPKFNNNVGLLSQGHGVFCEDGHETKCEFTNNLVIDVRGPEEIATVDDSITKIPHGFWLRRGNVIENNVYVGKESIGHVILPIRCKPCAAAFAGIRQQVTGCEVYGGGKYGIWSMEPNVDFVGGSAIYCELAGVAGSAPWGASSNGVTINEMLLAFNGNVSNDPYISQVYLNQAKEFGINKCWLVGRKAIHQHYNVTATMSNTLVNVGTFITPTYWESNLTATDNCNITAPIPFDRAYPKRSNNIGRLVIENSTYKFGPLEGTETLEFIGLAFKTTEPGEEFGVGQGKAWKVNN